MKTNKEIQKPTFEQHYLTMQPLIPTQDLSEQFLQAWEDMGHIQNSSGKFNFPSGTAIDQTQVILSKTGSELKVSEKLISLPYQLDKANSEIRFLTTEINKIKTYNEQLLSYIQNIKKELNVAKLERISQYEDNWNGFGAKKFNKQIINKVYSLLLDPSLKIQPSIFPTQRESLQLEFRINKFFIEVEIFDEEYEMNIENESTGKVDFFEKTDWKTIVDKLNELQSA